MATQIAYDAGGGLGRSLGIAVEYGPFIATGTYTPSMTADANCTSQRTFGIALKVDSSNGPLEPHFRIPLLADQVLQNWFPDPTGKGGLFLTTDGTALSFGGGVYLHGTGLLTVAPHTVIGACAIGSTCAVTLTGAEVFTSNTSYACTAVDQTGVHALSISQASGAAFTITGNGTDTVGFSCTGN
jgi:hypothetical protein